MIEITTIIPTINPIINPIELVDDKELLTPFEFDIPEDVAGFKFEVTEFVEDPNEAEVGKKVVEGVGKGTCEGVYEGVDEGVGIMLINGFPVF